MFVKWDPVGNVGSYDPPSLKRVRAAGRAGRLLGRQEEEADEPTHPSSSDLTEQRRRRLSAYRQVDAGVEGREDRTAILARDIMSRPVRTVASSSTLADAWDLLREWGVRHFPVVEGDRLVGMLSEGDLWREAADLGAAVSREKTVSDSIGEHVISVRPSTELKYVARAMVVDHIGALPVVGEDGTLLGILTRSDILWAIVRGPVDLWM